mmetsp:Transcript_62631/g.135996  ORF Transcript_62631/g.135996 Transcript_62631/m.135996 type:complete len:99 (-) Transcript_62631:549-845(-)
MVLLSNIVGGLQMLLMVILFANDAILPEAMRENKAAAFFGIFLGGSMLSSALTKTNAFEIYVGERLIWSTLKAERMPNLRDLVDSFAKVGVKISVPRS